MSGGGHESHYDTLGVEPSASGWQIRSAFHRLAKLYHPDKNPHRPQWAEARMRQLLEAYHTVSDKERRIAYDRGLERRYGARLAPDYRAARSPAGPVGAVRRVRWTWVLGIPALLLIVAGASFLAHQILRGMDPAGARQGAPSGSALGGGASAARENGRAERRLPAWRRETPSRRESGGGVTFDVGRATKLVAISFAPARPGTGFWWHIGEAQKVLTVRDKALFTCRLVEGEQRSQLMCRSGGRALQDASDQEWTDDLVIAAVDPAARVVYECVLGPRDDGPRVLQVGFDKAGAVLQPGGITICYARPETLRVRNDASGEIRTWSSGETDVWPLAWREGEHVTCFDLRLETVRGALWITWYCPTVAIIRRRRERGDLAGLAEQMKAAERAFEKNEAFTVLNPQGVPVARFRSHFNPYGIQAGKPPG